MNDKGHSVGSSQINDKASQRPSGPQAATSYVVCGVRIDGYSLEAAVRQVNAKASPKSVHLCNAYTLSLATRDRSYLAVLNSADLNFADGTPVAWIGRRLDPAMANNHVRGVDLMQACLDRGRATGVRHYLFGSTPETIELLQQRIVQRWPGALVVGAVAPPFGDLTDDDLVAAVEVMNQSAADVVWVGLGTPKQDVVVDRLLALGAPTSVAIGAAFDFIAETKAQAPLWVREHGLEWVHRLVTEPRRLWKRYLVGNSVFLWANIRSRPLVLPGPASAGAKLAEDPT